MRSSWLYLAMRSERDIEPVLICEALVATAMSAMVASSVSPERCDTTEEYPASAAILMAASVSVSVPIWFTLIRMELAIFLSMPSLRILVLVTNRSSPTSCIFLPSALVNVAQPAQSCSAMPSSMLMIGYFAASFAKYFTNSSEENLRPSPCRSYLFFL